MNLFVASGRVGSDAEIRYTQNQMAVAGFSVAVDYGFGDRKETVWIKCTLWGKRAEALSEYIRKGDMITVAGEIKLEQWEGRDGKSGANIALNVDKVTLGGAGSGQQRSDQQTHGGYQPAPGSQPAAQPATQPVDDFDDDIPF